MSHIEITRFSNDAFCAKEQIHHIGSMNYAMDDERWKIDFKNHPRMIKFMEKQKNDIDHSFRSGVFAFQKGYEETYYLNHLKKDIIKKLKCFTAKIPLNLMVFQDDGNPYLLSNQRIAEKAFPTMYIPETLISCIYDIYEIENIFSNLS
jgi:hypothetical protein